jgi:hypothetical protein
VSAFTTDQLVTLTELLVILLGVVVVWVVYHGSDKAELPGEAKVPDPGIPEDLELDNRGRTL